MFNLNHYDLVPNAVSKCCKSELANTMSGFACLKCEKLLKEGQYNIEYQKSNSNINTMNKIKEIYSYLQGKKTNIVVILSAVYGFLSVFGVVSITPEQQGAINTLILALLGFTLHDAVGRMGK